MNNTDKIDSGARTRWSGVLRVPLRLVDKVRGLVSRIKEHGLRLTLEHIMERLGDLLGFSEKKCLSIRPGLNHAERTPRILVSLSIHPVGIAQAERTINSLLRQTVRPDQLILHLDGLKTPNEARQTSARIARLLRRGVEIRRDEPGRSGGGRLDLYTEYPDAIIVTLDCGFRCPVEMIEWLTTAYRRNPNMIHCHCAQKMRFGVSSLGASRCEYDRIPSYLNQPIIGAGCLFPPRALSNSSIDNGRVFRFAPQHEDMQYWLMALSSDIKVNVVDLPLFRAPVTRFASGRKGDHGADHTPQRRLI